MQIAVIGAGITGLGAAWALGRHHDVTLYEAAPTLGGHARTVDVSVGGVTVPVDTGFIVYNERNYPNLTRLFAALDVATEESDMSFAVTSRSGGLEYGGRVGAMFSRKRNLFDGGVWSMLRGMNMFRGERALLRAGAVPDDVSIETYLAARRYPGPFIDYYLRPLASAVWSGAGAEVLAMPARTFLEFVDNHGLTALDDRPLWRTVSGGSRRYVDRIGATLDEVVVGEAVRAVSRTARGVEVSTDGTTRTFDHAVLATHADRSLQLLGGAASEAERQILGSFRYSANRAVMHRDARLMPRRRSVWSSWNVAIGDDAVPGAPASVTYWMNRLQNLDLGEPILVSLNPDIEPDPSLVIEENVFSHPQFDAISQSAQRRLGDIQGLGNIWHAGAHLGHGFHEDGLQAGLTVAAALGAPAPWIDSVRPVSPAAVHAAPRRSRVAA